MPRWDHRCIDKCQHGQKRRSFWIFHAKIGDIFRGGFYPLKKAGCQGRGRFLGSNIITRWWFQILFIFIPIWGRWTHFDSYFSKGLVHPPTRFGSDSFWTTCNQTTGLKNSIAANVSMSFTSLAILGPKKWRHFEDPETPLRKTGSFTFPQLEGRFSWFLGFKFLVAIFL